MQPPAESNQARRLEIILQQLESLPTLPAVAVRLLQVTSDEDSDARDVIDLVAADPALTGKVLAMCRSAARATLQPITTVDRAVVHLGFKAIRNAVLSIKVFELFGDPRNKPGPGHRLDLAGFWRHSLGVAIAAEMIADAHGLAGPEAFVCGLMHDIGKLALEHVLPRSYERVIELADEQQMNIAEVERRVIGIDHQTVGKRLAEHWQLPHMIQDSIWLHGSMYATLPDLAHKPLIGVVSVADLLVRRQHLGYSGNHDLSENFDTIVAEAGLDGAKVQRAAEQLPDELARRAEAMGLGQTPSQQMMLESVMQANAVLGRLNAQLSTRRKIAVGQAKVLEAITKFHERSGGPGRSAQDVLGAVAVSAAAVLGEGYYGLLYQALTSGPWLMNRYSADGRLLKSQFIEPPAGLPHLSQFRPAGPTTPVPMMTTVGFLAPHMPDGVDVSTVQSLALPCGWGAAAIVLFDRPRVPAGPALEALAHAWGAAVAAATQHQGARRLGEQLAEANRLVAETQATLLRQQSMARLGEMAAGAAHEMNNPLAVISGRAQLLAARLGKGSKEQQDADLIWKQSERLSNLITALRLFAEPPKPKMSYASPSDILESAVHLSRQRVPDAQALRVSGMEQAPPLHTDGAQLSAVIAELLINAHQANPRSAVRVAASVDPVQGRFMLKVTDDGLGMDATTLEHAFDPFFSAKAAGRQAGLGLSRAQRLIEGLGGAIELRSRSGQGTTATLSVPLTPPTVSKPTTGSTRSEGEVRAFKATGRR